ncbi:MAG: deoxyribodipyrimidine photo-lyase, partial [Pararheinheimera sp.]|nr:deoxyribodipyrimidine photo-lyase [Rheinheimera sp.]
MKRALVLFNEAMRWHDNLLLSQQADVDQLIAVLVLDPAEYLTTQYGIKRASLPRLQAQLHLMLDWQQQWQQKQMLLHIRIGGTAQCLQQVAQQYQAQILIAAEPTAPEQYQQLQRTGLKLKLYDINSLLQHELRPALATLPKSFSAFRKVREPELLVQQPQSYAVSPQFYGEPEQALDAATANFINQYHNP